MDILLLRGSILEWVTSGIKLKAPDAAALKVFVRGASMHFASALNMGCSQILYDYIKIICFVSLSNNK